MAERFWINGQKAVTKKELQDLVHNHAPIDIQ